MRNDVHEKFDIKTLVLKRWDASQTKHIFDQSSLQRGEYISFRSHHFIDVIPTCDDSGLLSTYNNLRKPYAFLRGNTALKKEPNTHLLPDIHVVQSMPLLGRDNEFWNEKANALYITLIQISDSAKWEYDRIYNEIKNHFQAGNMSSDNPSWALYYSLDYCDYVLFTKDIKLNDLNNLLWNMALVREGNFNIIRDTFTIHSFGWEYLRDTFAKLADSRKEPDLAWDDMMSLSMNFCIRDVSVVNKLKTTIDSIDGKTIKYIDTRLPGRFDLNITTESITGTQALKIIYHIDLILKDYFTKKQKNEEQDELPPPFTEYEITLMSDCAPNLPTKSNPPCATDFDKYAAELIYKIYSMLESKDSNSNTNLKTSYIDYVKEALRSIYELAINDFSEEFVLSVLPSLITFLRIAKQKQSFLSGEKDPKYINAIRSSCAKLQKSYFTALTTLSLCTMHSERQFIHTPAFNANFFDIPPKLIAYYNAIAYKIAFQLKDKSRAQPAYHYVITPDYRTDIHVEPLNISYSRDTSEHLAIINLPERFFYQPQKTIMLFAHEVGHYEGDRKRDIRAKHIFCLIGTVILRHTPLASIIDSNQTRISNNNLLGMLADSFGAYLLEQYNNQANNVERGISYLLSSISDFLIDCRYGFAFFLEFAHKVRIIDNWIHVLRNVCSDESLNQEITKMLEILSVSKNTDYFKKFSKNTNCVGACAAIAQSIANRVETLYVDDKRGFYSSVIRLCQHIIDLFSESYADMQMASVLGNEYFGPERYCSMLGEIETNEVDADEAVQEFTEVQYLRYTIMLRRRGIAHNNSLDLLQETIVDSVLDYLCQCDSSADTENESTSSMTESLGAIYSPQTNWKAWCKSLCNELASYEKAIQKMYDENDEGIIEPRTS